MEEQEPPVTEQKKTETSEEGKYETTPIIERAREEREKMEAANKKREELLDREEQIMAKKALGGQAEAGSAPVKKEISPQEYADAALRGELDKL